MKKLPTWEERLELYNIFNKETNKLCGRAMISRILYDVDEPRIKWSTKKVIQSLIDRSINKSENIVPIKMADYEKIKN